MKTVSMPMEDFRQMEKQIADARELRRRLMDYRDEVIEKQVYPELAITINDMLGLSRYAGFPVTMVRKGA